MEETCATVIKRALMRPGVLKALLVCGIASSLLYVGIDLLASAQWEEYRYFSQAFSELTAIEAPTRPLMLYALEIPYNLLVLAFGLGVWLLAGQKRGLRIIAGSLVTYAVIGFMGGVVFPMHSRGTQEGITFTDLMHIISTGLGVLTMLLFLGYGAAAFGKRFRAYSIITILLLIFGAAWTGFEATRMAAGLPTPWMGVTERVNIYPTLLWMLVLAVMLWPAEKGLASPASSELAAGQ
jgi:hypothetical protein